MILKDVNYCVGRQSSQIEPPSLYKRHQELSDLILESFIRGWDIRDDDNLILADVRCSSKLIVRTEVALCYCVGIP